MSPMRWGIHLPQYGRAAGPESQTTREGWLESVKRLATALGVG